MTTTIAVIVAAVTALNVIGCLWLLWWTRKKSPSQANTNSEFHHQAHDSQLVLPRVALLEDSQLVLPRVALLEESELAKAETKLGISATDVDTTGHVWDDDIMEYNHPLPKWWLNLFYLTIVFAVLYLIVYPGFGNYRGTFGWTSTADHDRQAALQRARYAASFAPFETMPIAEISKQPKAMQLAQGLYNNRCAACHGADAKGARGFPNLTDADWLYGGDSDSLTTTLVEGRQAVMPAWKDALGGDAGVAAVVDYVIALSTPNAQLAAPELALGKQHYESFCIACHGPDGKGMQALGAPNLTDSIWLYGGDRLALTQTIASGRNGVMPAHGQILSAEQIRVLVAWIDANAATTPSAN
jgi:cytochrome c oxidase cbb3-type subunit III